MRGSSARAIVAAGSDARASSDASSHGDFALAWSRRVIMSSLGESGFSVFQAGHCDWQRPHSVQVEKSRRPFQVKSSTLPTPSTGSGASSSSFSEAASMASIENGWPSPIVIGLRLPRAVRPDESRLNQMLGKARKRCHATPIVGVSEMVIIHANEMMILIVATMTMTVLSPSSDRPEKMPDSQPVSGKCSARLSSGCSSLVSEASSRRRVRMQSVTPRIVNST